MKITDTQIKLLKDHSKSKKALATVVIDDAIVIHGITLYENNDKFSFSMPNRKLNDGKLKDYVHPINADIRKVFQETLEAEYRKFMANLPAEEVKEEVTEIPTIETPNTEAESASTE